jgi:hypothetical protein
MSRSKYNPPKPIIEICSKCKESKVKNHHFLCDKCYGKKQRNYYNQQQNKILNGYAKGKDRRMKLLKQNEESKQNNNEEGIRIEN